MEDKEIEFWLRHPEWTPPYLEECDMDWEKIVSDYYEKKRKEKELGIDKVRANFSDFLNSVSTDMLDDFEDGVLPAGLSSIIDIDPKTGHFVSKEYPDIVIGTIYDIYDAIEAADDSDEVEANAAMAEA